MPTAPTEPADLAFVPEPRSLYAKPHRWTVEEYDLMVELGALTPEMRVELLDGLIVDRMPNNPPHASPVSRLNRFFAQREGGRWVTLCQLPVRLPKQCSEPEPDIALLQPPDQRYTLQHPEPTDVFLLVEVADSSLRIDRCDKLAIYARAAIPEYWIVNVSERLIEVYREPDPAAGRYASAREVRPGETLAPAAFPDAALVVAELLG